MTDNAAIGSAAEEALSGPQSTTDAEGRSANFGSRKDNLEALGAANTAARMGSVGRPFAVTPFKSTRSH